MRFPEITVYNSAYNIMCYKFKDDGTNETIFNMIKKSKLGVCGGYDSKSTFFRIDYVPLASGQGEFYL